MLFIAYDYFGYTDGSTGVQRSKVYTVPIILVDKYLLISNCQLRNLFACYKLVNITAIYLELETHYHLQRISSLNLEIEDDC